MKAVRDQQVAKVIGCCGAIGRMPALCPRRFPSPSLRHTDGSRPRQQRQPHPSGTLPASFIARSLATASAELSSLMMLHAEFWPGKGRDSCFAVTANMHRPMIRLSCLLAIAAVAVMRTMPRRPQSALSIFIVVSQSISRLILCGKVSGLRPSGRLNGVLKRSKRPAIFWHQPIRSVCHGFKRPDPVRCVSLTMNSSFPRLAGACGRCHPDKNQHFAFTLRIGASRSLLPPINAFGRIDTRVRSPTSPHIDGFASISCTSPAAQGSIALDLSDASHSVVSHR